MERIRHVGSKTDYQGHRRQDARRPSFSEKSLSYLPFSERHGTISPACCTTVYTPCRHQWTACLASAHCVSPSRNRKLLSFLIYYAPVDVLFTTLVWFRLSGLWYKLVALWPLVFSCEFFACTPRPVWLSTIRDND